MKAENTPDHPNSPGGDVFPTAQPLIYGTAIGSVPVVRSLGDGASFSGNERDSVYLSKDGKDFVNISGITGLDDPGDGRSFAIFDYDRDGWPDVVVTSVTAPAIQIYRNRMGDDTFAAVRKNQMIAFNLVGGNHSPLPSKEWSNRNGYGARVTVDLGDSKIVRALHAGKGYGAQNSSTLLIGIGDRSVVHAVTVRWPSGKVQELGKIAANRLVTIYENRKQSPIPSEMSVRPYKIKAIRPPKNRDPILR